MFKLLRYFSVSSAVVIVLLTVSMGYVYRWLATSRVVADAVAIHQAVAKSVTTQTLERHRADLAEGADPAAQSGLQPLPRLAELEHGLRQSVARHSQVLVQIIAANGQRIAASSLRQTDDRLPESAQLRAAFAGQIMQPELIRGTTVEDETGHVHRGDAVRTIELLAGDPGQTSVALVITSDVTQRLQQVNHDTWIVIGFTSAVCTLLYLSLLFMVARAHRTLRRQYRLISSFNARLKGEVHVRTHRLEQQQRILSELINSPVFREGTATEALSLLTNAATAILAAEDATIAMLTRDGHGYEVIDTYRRSLRRHQRDYCVVRHMFPSDAARAAPTAHPLAIQDTATDPHLDPIARSALSHDGLRALIEIPILLGGTPCGVLSVRDSMAPRVWSAEDVLFVTAIANLAALAIEQDRRRQAQTALAASHRDLERQQSVLTDLLYSQALRTGSLADALRQLARSLAGAARVDRVGMTILTPHRDGSTYAEAYVAATDSFEPTVRKATFTVDDVINSVPAGRRIVANDSHSHPELAHLVDSVLRPLDVRSSIVQPIEIGYEVVGVINISACGTPVEWRSDQVLFATAIANLAALVIERHRRAIVETDLRNAMTAAEAASRAKSQFLANMSHEIRTPMNGVTGMTELLLQTPLNERQRRLVGTISQSSQALLTIIDDVLDLSRIEAGRLSLTPAPFDPREVIDQVQDLLGEAARKKGLPLRLAIESSLPGRLLGDEARLRQVLLNLVGNALKFTTVGHIQIRLSVRSVPGYTPQDARAELLIVIEDTGIGIPAATLANLFKPFTQADESITRQFGGTGLGLSISRQLMSLMGGTLTLASEIGRGTTATLAVVLPRAGDLPVAKPLKEQLAAPALPPPDSSARGRHELHAASGALDAHVLVAEDNPVNQEVLREFLTGFGCTFRIVANGAAALSAIADEPFDVVLMDCQMPGMDGLTATRQLRADEAASGRPRLPVIAVTAHAFEQDRAACTQAGMDQYLSKPFREQQLVEVLRQVLGADAGEPSRQAEPMATVMQPDLDDTTLAALRRTRPQLYERLVATYVTHSPRTVSELVTAIQGGQITVLKLAAHSLKSSSANVGARRVALLARQIETLADQSELAAAARVARDLQDEFAHVLEVLSTDYAAIRARNSRT